MSPQELFIYWRCDPAHDAEAVTAAARMQSTLRTQHPGLQTRLYRRSEAGVGHSTLMESYAAPAVGITPATVAAIDAAAAALNRWCQGRRHLEWFEPVSTDPD